jgi:hypothetical protein
MHPFVVPVPIRIGSAWLAAGDTLELPLLAGRLRLIPHTVCASIA